MDIKKSLIGQIKQTNIYEVIMTDGDKMKVHLLSYGATIRQIGLFCNDGTIQNVLLGYEDWQSYIRNPLFAGASLGPNAGRISQAELLIDGHVYPLTRNDECNNLHGGKYNISYMNWEVEDIKTETDYCSVTFSVQLCDGLDGFPGNRQIKIRYTLRNNRSLEINYYASTDKSTYFNLSNHSYFNLSGDFRRSALLQELCILADQYVINNAQHIPIDIALCSRTPFDFRGYSSLISHMESDPKNAQLKNAKGYNNAFILSDASLGIKKALSLKDSTSGRQLHLYTDAPCIVVYSGGYIGGDHTLLGQVPSSDFCALALEAQDIPDTVHFAPQSFHVTKLGKPFKRTIIYQFE